LDVLDDIENCFQSIRFWVAEFPTAQQESLISRFDDEVALLRHLLVIFASSAETEKQLLRDSISAGVRQIETLTQELSSTE